MRLQIIIPTMVLCSKFVIAEPPLSPGLSPSNDDSSSSHFDHSNPSYMSSSSVEPNNPTIPTHYHGSRNLGLGDKDTTPFMFSGHEQSSSGYPSSNYGYNPQNSGNDLSNSYSGYDYDSNSPSANGDNLVYYGYTGYESPKTSEFHRPSHDSYPPLLHHDKHKNYGIHTSSSYSPYQTLYESDKSGYQNGQHYETQWTNRNSNYGKNFEQQLPLAPVNSESLSSYGHNPNSENHSTQRFPSYLVPSTQPIPTLDYDLGHHAYMRPNFYEYKSTPQTYYDEPHSYAPPRNFLKSVINGITSSIPSLLKPTVSTSSEPWKPMNLFQSQVPDIHQDELHRESPVKHIYIHSANNKPTEEVNLKLILFKPSANQEERKYSSFLANSIEEERNLTPSSLLPFPISDTKRSKINAQLYFVRYKSPLNPWSHRPFRTHHIR